MMSLISLLILLIILGVVAWLFFYFVSLLPIAQPFKNAILAVGVLILIVLLLSWGTGAVRFPVVTL